MKTVIKCTDGSVAVMTLVDGADLAEALRKWGDVNPGKYLSHREMPDDAIPIDRRLRDAWGDTTQELIIDIDTTKAKTCLAKLADRLALEKRAAVVAGVSPAEMASWPIKRTEALAYQASSNSADAPSLAAEATARQITLSALTAKVIAKSSALSALEAAIAGANGLHNDTIAQLATIEAIQAYDVAAGWPV